MLNILEIPMIFIWALHCIGLHDLYAYFFMHTKKTFTNRPNTLLCSLEMFTGNR